MKLRDLDWKRGLTYLWDAKWFLLRFTIGIIVLSPVLAVNLVVEALNKATGFVDDLWCFLLDHGPIDWLGKVVTRFVGQPPNPQPKERV